MFCNKQEKKKREKTDLSFSEIAFKIWVFTFELWFSQEIVEYDYICIDFSSFCDKCNSFLILCTFWCCKAKKVALEVVKINIFGGCAEPKEVCFLKGSRSFLWWCLCVICIWLLSGLLNGFWGLDVALGLRVNQYKLFVYLFLLSNSFKFSCYCFTGINNRFFFWCFAVLSFVSWLTEFLIWFLANNFILA